MNKYGAIWRGRECEVMADTLYQAQQLAVIRFQEVAGRAKVKGYDITVALLELEGEPYIHVAS